MPAAAIDDRQLCRDADRVAGRLVRRLGLAAADRAVTKIGLPSADPEARLTIATGLLIIGVEHLRVVRGDVAREIIQGATLQLEALGRELEATPRLAGDNFSGRS